MAKAVKKDDLGYLNVEFQQKLAKCFIEDAGFFEKISSIVDQNAFTDIHLRNFVGTLKDYYAKENVVPSYSTIKIALRAKASTDIELEEADAIVKSLQETSIEGFSLVEDYALKFFKQQNYIKVANKILDIVSKGDLERVEECKELLQKAELIGQDDEYGFSPYDLEDKALSPEYKVPIPTGVSKLDEVLNGGLEKKKVGVIIGSAGFGKSTFSTAISSYASTYKCDLNNNEGYKVLQIFFEDDDVDVARKHFARITGVEARKLTSSKEQTDEIRDWLNKYPDKEMMKKNLRLVRFRTGTKSATDIYNYIKKITNTGFKPDLVIIDYFECLVPEKGGYNTDSKWDREGVTMRKIENMAAELNIAVWVPTQGNKGSITSPDVVTMDQAGGSIMKIQVAQVVISIARSLEDIDKSKATLAVLKNRSGKSGNVFHNIKFDNGTSTISCDEVIEFDNEMLWKEEEEKIKEREKLNLARMALQIGKTTKQQGDERNLVYTAKEGETLSFSGSSAITPSDEF